MHVTTASQYGPTSITVHEHMIMDHYMCCTDAQHAQHREMYMQYLHG